jgi:hypothetical protein
MQFYQKWGNWKTARDVVFGMTKYGWLGVAHLTAEKGYEHLKYLLGNLRSKEKAGTLYRILINGIYTVGMWHGGKIIEL